MLGAEVKLELAAFAFIDSAHSFYLSRAVHNCYTSLVPHDQTNRRNRFSVPPAGSHERPTWVFGTHSRPGLDFQT
jgi:hypothetical protein